LEKYFKRGEQIVTKTGEVQLTRICAFEPQTFHESQEFLITLSSVNLSDRDYQYNK